MRASRVSKRTGETFLTRKDRRIFDEQYLQPRERKRMVSPSNKFEVKTTRRAKALRKDTDYAS